MSDGREVYAGPADVYIAAAGTAFPTLDDAPADFDDAWQLLGANGNKNQDDSGVVLTLNETTNEFSGAGATRGLNAWRTAEGGTIALSLADMSIATFAAVMDMATVTTVAAGSGTVGKKSISLDRGIQTYKYALVLRLPSPEAEIADDLPAQFNVVRSYQSGNQAPAFSKSNPALLAVEFTILEGLSGGDSVAYEVATAPATT
jgi:hypothetical protein